MAYERVAILVVSTVALMVFYLSWTYGAGWRWVPVGLTALFTVTSVVAAVGNFPQWNAVRRERFNEGVAVAGMALLLAMAVGDALAAAPGSIDFLTLSCAFGIPFVVLVGSLLVERRQTVEIEEPSKDSP